MEVNNCVRCDFIQISAHLNFNQIVQFCKQNFNGIFHLFKKLLKTKKKISKIKL